MFACCCAADDHSGSAEIMVTPVVTEDKGVPAVGSKSAPAKFDRGNEKEAVPFGTFTVVISPEEDWMTSSNLGIEVDQTVDQNSGPMIIDLAMGSVIEEFNERNPRQAIELYDRVVAVDDIFEDGEAIAARLQEPFKGLMTLTLRRPLRMKVHLEKPGSLGMKLDFRSRTIGAVISEISPEGLAAIWNEDNPDSLVEVGNRILELNGTKHRGPDLIESIKTCSKPLMILTVLKYP